MPCPPRVVTAAIVLPVFIHSRADAFRGMDSDGALRLTGLLFGLLFVLVRCG